jgi:hypothetical protein
MIFGARGRKTWYDMTLEEVMKEVEHTRLHKLHQRISIYFMFTTQRIEIGSCSHVDT